MYKLNVIALAGLALIVSAAAMAAEHPDEASMAPAQVAALFSVVNGKADAAEADGGPVIRWQIAVGQTSQLALRKESPIFSRLRYYDRFEFEFRVVSGEISSLDMQALGHVSGAYQCKVHEWHLSVHSTAKPDWNRRQIELARPAWYPWDSPDGEGGDFFRLSSLALSPGTVIELRNLRLSRSSVRLKPDFEMPITWPVLTRNKDGSVLYTARYMLHNSAGHPVEIEGTVTSTHSRFKINLRNADAAEKATAPTRVTLKNGQVATFELTAAMTAEDIKATEELYAEPLELSFAVAGDKDSACRWQGFLVRPLSPGLKRQVLVPQQKLEIIRNKLAAGDADVRRLLGLDTIVTKADEFLGKKLLSIPGGYSHTYNRFEGDWLPGDAMPEAVNTKTGEREFGTIRAGDTWKAYLAYPGFILEKLGQAYLYTGDEKYARKAIELFDLYARQYRELPWGGGGGLALPWDRSPVTLCGSRVAMTSSYGSNMNFKWHCQLLSMTSESPAWTEEKRRNVYMNFVLPYATELMKFPGGINNMTDVSNHNLLLLGLVFDDAALVRHATMTASGLISRLADIDADGFSSEGRPLNYHFAGMEEYLPTIGYLANSGIVLKYPKDNLLAAFRMPFKRAALNGMVPSTGDCGRGQQVGPNGLADHLVAIFPKEDWLYEAGASPFTAWFAGKKPQPNGWMGLLSAEPVLFPHAGLAILRSGATADAQVMATLDYGRNVMHASLDRNQITLIAFEKVFTHGPGSLYNLGSAGKMSDNTRLNAFCNNGSLAQNVVLVDQQDQLPAAGQLLAWHAGPDLQVAASRVDGIAPGVSHVRALVLIRGVVVVLDRLSSAQEHTYDFTYHNFGELTPGAGWNATPAVTALGTIANYDNIMELKRLQGTGSLLLEWDLTRQTPPQQGRDAPSAQEASAVKLAFWQSNPDGGDVYTGITGLNNPNNGCTPDRAPSLFHRVRGRTAEFATVLEPNRGQSAIRSVQFPSAACVNITWKGGGGTTLTLDDVLTQYSSARSAKQQTGD